MKAEAIAAQAAALVEKQGKGQDKTAGPHKAGDDGSTQQTSGFDEPAVQVELSETAKSFLESHGRSADSTAHRARAAIEGNLALAELPFGKVVSALARGLDPAGLLASPEGGDAEGGVDAATAAGAGETATEFSTIDGDEPVEDGDGLVEDGEGLVVDGSDDGIAGGTFTDELVDLVDPDVELPPTLDELIAAINDPDKEDELPPTIEDVLAEISGDTADS